MAPDEQKALGFVLLVGGALTAAWLALRELRPQTQPPKPIQRPTTSRPTTGGKSPARRRRRLADPRAFVSFDFDHNEQSRRLFVGQGKEDSPTPFTIGDWSSKEALAQSDWEAKIKDKIGRCHMVIVLVGRSMATATGVVKEIVMAKELDVPVFGVYVDSATSTSTLPTGLPRSRTIAWTWPGVAAMIDQCMTEGKNKK